jgi:hypothetical protein
VFPELGERNVLSHGHAVADNVQIRSRKVNDLFASRVLYVSVANIPLPRNCPVENLGSGRHFMYFKTNVGAQLAQCVPDAIAGDASANGIDLGGQRKDFLAYSFCRKSFTETIW